MIRPILRRHGRRLAFSAALVLAVAVMVTAQADRYAAHRVPSSWVGHSYTPSPADWRRVAVYQVMTDRFANGDPQNDRAHTFSTAYDQPSGDYPQDQSRRTIGGDFKGLTQNLDYIKSLGYDAIWISAPLMGAEPNGYAPVTYSILDPKLGTAEEFRTLINEAHARGMYVIVDCVANHFANWFHDRDQFNGSGYGDPQYKYGSDRQYGANFGDPLGPRDFHNNGNINDWNNGYQLEQGELVGLDDLRTENEWVRNYVIERWSNIIKAFDIDGFRVDAIKHININDMSQMAAAWRAAAASVGKTNFYMFGEAFSGSHGAVGYYTGNKAGTGRRVMNGMMDYAMYMDGVPWKLFNDQWGLKNWIAGMNNSSYDMGQGDGSTTWNFANMNLHFADNHDNPRFLSTVGDWDQMAAVSGLLTTIEGVGGIYYGSEQAFNTGGKDGRGAYSAMFDHPYQFDNAAGDNFNQTHYLYRTMARIMRARRAIGAGLGFGTDLRDPQNGIFSYKRGNDALVAINGTAGDRTASLSFGDNGTYTDLINNRSVTGPNANVSLGKYGVGIFVRNGNYQALEPMVEAVTPAFGARADVTSVTITFDRDMDHASAVAAASISPNPGGTWSVSGRNLTLTGGAFQKDWMYTVRVERTAKSLYGTAMHGGFQSRFWHTGGNGGGDNGGGNGGTGSGSPKVDGNRVTFEWPADMNAPYRYRAAAQIFVKGSWRVTDSSTPGQFAATYDAAWNGGAKSQLVLNGTAETWVATISLDPSKTFEYGFEINGIWTNDPRNPNHAANGNDKFTTGEAVSPLPTLTVTPSGTAAVHEAITITTTQPGKLHWGVNGSGGRWTLPAFEYRPAGTIVFDTGAVQTPLVGPDANGKYSVSVGPFLGSQSVSSLDFVVAYADGRWDNNNRADYHVRIDVPVNNDRPTLKVNGREGNYGTIRLFVDELRGDVKDVSVEFAPNSDRAVTDVQCFTNLDRRDFATLTDVDASLIEPNSAAPTYFKAYTMFPGAAGYTVNLPVSKTGVYRLTVRYKVQGDPNWRWFSNGVDRRDAVVVVSPEKARNLNMYELQVNAIEATDDNWASRSTFADLTSADNDGYNPVSIDSLRSQGINTVWIQPIHPIGSKDEPAPFNQQGDPGSPYAVKNFFAVNQVLGADNTREGAMAEFRQFMSEADQKGLNVFFDVTFNHSAWDVEIGPYGAQIGAGPTTQIRDIRPGWYTRRDASKSYLDSTSYIWWERARNRNEIAVAPADRHDFGKWADVTDFFFGTYSALGSPKNEQDGIWSHDSTVNELVEYFTNYSLWWLEQTGNTGNAAASNMGIDGFRCDFAQGVPPQAWEYIINKTRARKWDFIFMAESLDGGEVSRRAARQFDIVNDNWVWSTENEFNPGPWRQAVERHREAYDPGMLVLRNVVTHDHHAPEDPWMAAMRTGVHATLDGVPLVYAGMERGLKLNYGYAHFLPQYGRYHMNFKTWNDLTLLWDSSPVGMPQYYANVMRARENSPALRSGNQWFLFQKNGQPHGGIYAVAKWEPTANGATEAVLAFVNMHYWTAQNGIFDVAGATGPGGQRLDIQAGRRYNVVNLASSDPAKYLWPEARTGADILANGIYVGFSGKKHEDGQVAQFLKLVDPFNVPDPNLVTWTPQAPTAAQAITLTISRPGKLLWGVNAAGSTWTRPIAAYRPAGTTEFGATAIESPFTGPDAAGKYHLTIGPFTNSDQAVRTIDFVIHYADDTWNNNGGADFHVTVTPAVDTTPPAAPTGLTGIAGVNAVNLSWNANTEPDFARYVLYVKSASAETFIVAGTRAPIGKDTGLLAYNLTGGTQHLWYLRAVDNAGNVSDASAILECSPLAEVIDTVAPTAPAGLSAAAGVGTITLNWTANGESDLAGYNVYDRTYPNGIPQKLNVSLVVGTTYTVRDLPAGQPFTYAVAAVDYTGNVSALSSTVTATPLATLDTRPAVSPASPNGNDVITVSVRAPGKLHWAVNGWTKPAAAYWPAGTVSYDTNAVQTPFSGPDASGAYSVQVGPFTGTVSVSELNYVIAYADGSWDNNGRLDYKITVAPAPAGNRAPTVRIIDPVEAQAVTGTRTLLAEASDDNGIPSVTFAVDGTILGTVTTPVMPTGTAGAPAAPKGARGSITIDGVNTNDEWTAAHRIASDPAWDHANVVNGAWSTHETPFDYTDLYAAWDDQYLYIGIQIVDVTDVKDPANAGSSAGTPARAMNLPQFIALDVVPGGYTGVTASGGDAAEYDAWHKGHLWNNGGGVDYQVYFASNFWQGPFLVPYSGRWNADANTIRPSATGLAGKSGAGNVRGQVFGVNGEEYVGQGHNKARDSFFEIRIPLANIGNPNLDQQAIGLFVAHGDGDMKAGIDCIPNDPATTNTVGVEPWNSPKEWADVDIYTTPFVRAGTEGSGPVTPVYMLPFHSATLLDGPHTITATAVDAQDSRTTTSVRIATINGNIIVDTVPPALVVDALPETVTEPLVTVSGTAQDAVSAVTVWVNESAVTVGAAGAFGWPLPLLPNRNTIVVTARDLAGNTAVETRYVHYAAPPDTTPPGLWLETRSETTMLAVATVVGWIPLIDLPGVGVAVNGVPVTGWSSYPMLGRFVHQVPLAEGHNTIRIVVTDAAGNETAVNIWMHRVVLTDTTAPVITLDPIPGLVNAATLAIAGSVNETASVTVNGSAASVAGLRFAATINLVIGDNAITVRATDQSGNASTVTQTVTRPDPNDPYAAYKVPSSWPGHAFTPSPADWRHLAVYQLMTDRFYDADPSNNTRHIFSTAFNAPGNELPVEGHRRTIGGDFRGMTEHLDYIKSLGFDVIWISAPLIGAEANGYAPVSYGVLDPKLGTVAEFREFVDAAHARGMYVVVDCVSNHFANWFRDYDNFNGSGYGTPQYGTQEPRRYGAQFGDAIGPDNFHNNGRIGNWNDPYQLERGELVGLDDLRTEDAYVRSYVIEKWSNIIKALDVDGFRVDAIKHVNVHDMAQFASAWRAAAQSVGKNNFYMFGEAFSGSHGAVGYYTGSKAGTSAKVMNGMMDYAMFLGGVPWKLFNDQWGLKGWISGMNSGDYDMGQGTGSTWTPGNLNVHFADNHDVARFPSTVGDRDQVAAMTALLTTIEGLGAVYYGSEQGFNTGGTDGRGAYAAMFDHDFEWDAAVGDNFNMTSDLYKKIARIMRARRRIGAGLGTSTWLNDPQNGIFSYRRGNDALVAINGTANQASATLSFGASGTYVDLVGGGTVTGPSASVTLPKYGTAIYVRNADASLLEPMVESVTPGHGSNGGVTDVTITFDRDMDPTTTIAAASITPNPGGSWNVSNRVLKLTGGTFEQGVEYTVRVERTARGLNNQSLHGGFLSRFRAGSGGGAVISPEISGTNVTFRYSGSASSVSLKGSWKVTSGSYTNYSATYDATWNGGAQTPMVPQNGAWTVTLALEAGKTYEYGFVVNGAWTNDPANSTHAGNGNDQFSLAALAAPAPTLALNQGVLFVPAPAPSTTAGGASALSLASPQVELVPLTITNTQPFDPARPSQALAVGSSAETYLVALTDVNRTAFEVSVPVYNTTAGSYSDRFVLKLEFAEPVSAFTARRVTDRFLNPAAVRNDAFGDQVFGFEVFDAAGTDVGADTAKVVSARLEYHSTAASVNGTPLQDLALQYYNPATGKFERLETTYDAIGGLVWARLEHLSTYGIFPDAAGVAQANLNAVIIYPNPFVPGDNNADNGVEYSAANLNSGIVFDRLTNNVTITIYTVRGQKISERVVTTGRAQWDAKTPEGDPVASGVYIVVIKDNNGRGQHVERIAIVR